MEGWIKQLEEWKNELLRPNSRDILIQLSENSKKIIPIADEVNGGAHFVLPYSADIKIIVNEQHKIQKHIGVNSLCVAQGVLEWSYGESIFCSPLYLFPATEKIDYVKQKVHIQLAEDPILNPFLEKLLFSKTAISLSEILASEVLPNGWNRSENAYLGNFHYHRHSILKDVDFYIESPASFSSNLGAFFNGTMLKEHNLSINTLAYVYPQDEDQKKAGEALAKGKNITLSGPPGTGKSQFLANTVFQHILSDRWVVLSSEKQVAMQVVLNKLAEKNLGDACLMIGNTVNDKTELIRSLQKSWAKMEHYQTAKNDVLLLQSIFETRYKAFEHKLARLQQLPDVPLTKPLNTEVAGEIPSHTEWGNAKEKINQLNEFYFGWCGKTVNLSLLKYIRLALLPTADSWRNLATELNHFTRELEKLNQVLPQKWQIACLKELKYLNRLGIHATLLQQDLFIQHPDLFDVKSKKHKRYLQVSARFLKRKEQLTQFSEEEQKRKIERVALEELAEILRQNKRGLRLLGCRKKTQALFGSKGESNVVLLARVEQQLACVKLKELLSIDKQELLEMGIRSPENEILFIDTLLLQFQKMEIGLLDLLQQEDRATIKLLSAQSQHIAHLLHFLTNHLRIEEADELKQVSMQIIQDSSFFGQHHVLLQELERNHTTSLYMALNIVDWKELELHISLGNVLKFKAAFPDLFQYSGVDFSDDLTQVLELEDSCMKTNSSLFDEKQHAQFRKYHMLLNTPAQKLSYEEKELKKTLRSGRNLLIKEFNKQKQHMPIRQLMESDAAPWIRLLKPVWMINPLQIAEILPNEKECIDLLLMDEASQIPFVHALPALYRAKQIGIVGDCQQMAPNDYFVLGKGEQETLLDRVSYHTNSFALNYHYRSQHPDLIAFSNAYFYENKLNVFLPNWQDKSNGLHFHHVDQAVYVDRGNEKEAEALANWLIANREHYPKKEQFLIVSFSEKQLQLIENKLSNISNKNIYFKSLENVQGDEADHVLISLGYARNEEGKFLQHFGPVNQGGGEKRLNVLCSRARKSMHLFSSVSHHDFRLSDNIGADLLRLFHGIVEGGIPIQGGNDTVLDKWKLEYRMDKKEIKICNPNKTRLNTQNWMTLLRVLKQREWKVSFVFAKDEISWLNTVSPVSSRLLQ